MHIYIHTYVRTTYIHIIYIYIFFAMAVRTNDARALAPSLELPAAVLKE